jgi:hypothetical protein
MDQRPGQLNRDEETNLSKTNDLDNVSIRAATSKDVRDSEKNITEDLQNVQGNSDEASDEPEQIKEQIEQTRSQLGETIDAIQEKLSFSNISEGVKEQVSEQINNAVETAKEAVYDATIGKAENIMQTVSEGLNNVSEGVGDAGSYVMRTAKRNPLPLALIGLGVGMLLMQGNRSKSIHAVKNGKHKKGSQQGDSNPSSLVGKQAAEATRNALHSAQETVGNVAGSVYQGVSNLATSTGDQVQQVTRQVRTQYERTLEENPLIIGAIALGVGAIVGLSIPSTGYENQWMGETKENLVQSVEGAAREALEKAQQVAGEVTKTVREQAQGQG